MIRILTNPATLNPAKEIARALVEKHVPATASVNADIHMGDMVVNYGCARRNGINTAEFVGFCGNKLRFSDVLSRNGFNTPIYNTGGVPQEYPVVVRTTLHGMGGVGISFANNEAEFNQQFRHGYYWTKFYRCSFELRVHVLGGEIARIFKKLKEQEDDCPIRNSQHGYHYSLRDPNNYEKVFELVEEFNEIATELAGPNCFYALDIGYEDATKSYVIYEANSAPGLNSNTARVYADYFKSLLP